MQSIDGNAKGTLKKTKTKRKKKKQQLTNGNRGQATKEPKTKETNNQNKKPSSGHVRQELVKFKRKRPSLAPTRKAKRRKRD